MRPRRKIVSMPLDTPRELGEAVDAVVCWMKCAPRSRVREWRTIVFAASAGVAAPVAAGASAPPPSVLALSNSFWARADGYVAERDEGRLCGVPTAKAQAPMPLPSRCHPLPVDR